MKFQDTLTNTIWEFKSVDDFLIACYAYEAANIPLKCRFHSSFTRQDVEELLSSHGTNTRVILTESGTNTWMGVLQGVLMVSVTSLLFFLQATSKGIHVTLKEPHLDLPDLVINNKSHGEAKATWNFEGLKLKVDDFWLKFPWKFEGLKLNVDHFWPKFF